MSQCACAYPRAVWMDQHHHPIDKDSVGLVRRYASTKSTKFEDFKIEWLKCKFYFMHCIRNGKEESFSKVAVIERIFTTMIEILVDSDADIFERLGSLYLCYSLYCTQLTSDSIKIRVSLSDYEMIQLFHSELRRQGIHDGDYAFCRLKSLSAFLVCASRKRKCMGQQMEVCSGELITLGDLGSLDHRSDLMVALREGQKRLQDYELLKECISDHLPLNLVTKCSVLDELLDKERIKTVKYGPEDGPTEARDEDEEGGSDEESRRSRVLQRQFRKAPKQVDKLK